MDLPATADAPTYGYRRSIGLAITVTASGYITFWVHWRDDVLVPIDSPLIGS